MSIFPPKVSEAIGGIVDVADQFTRDQMSLGIVTTENEYTAVFASTFRLLMGSFPAPFVVTARVNSPKAERRTGTDACIILRNGVESKILLYEAKLFTNNKWDRLKKSSGFSHFDSQLERQTTKVPACAVVYEIFYTRRPLGKSLWNMHPLGATCVPRDSAIAFRGSPSPRAPAWRPKDARGLFMSNPPVLSFGDVVEEMSNCHLGAPTEPSEVEAFLETAGRLSVLSIAGPKEFEFDGDKGLAALRGQITSLFSIPRLQQSRITFDTQSPFPRLQSATSPRKNRSR